MDTPTQEEIQARFNELPEDVRHAIQSADMTQALQGVGAAHELHLDQLGALEDEALLVMLGFSNPANFAARIGEALRLDQSTATAVASELSEKLFVPIRDSMRRFMEARVAEVDASREPKTAAPPAVNSAPAPRPAANIIPAQGGGKTIMPSGAAPVPHPVDRALSETRIVLPQVTDLSPAPATPAPTAPTPPAAAAPAATPAVDPYREPIE